MRAIILTLALLPAISAPIQADEPGINGIISLPSPHSVKQTADKLAQALKAKGMTIFKRVDHSAGAKKAGLKLRPTELIIFGNPKVGTPLMHCAQTAALDLPQKALIWEDKNHNVWLSYNDPDYIAQRHNISDCSIVVNKIRKALDRFAHAAVEQ